MVWYGSHLSCSDSVSYKASLSCLRTSSISLDTTDSFASRSRIYNIIPHQSQKSQPSANDICSDQSQAARCHVPRLLVKRFCILIQCYWYSPHTHTITLSRMQLQPEHSVDRPIKFRHVKTPSFAKTVLKPFPFKLG